MKFLSNIKDSMDFIKKTWKWVLSQIMIFWLHLMLMHYILVSLREVLDKRE